MRILELYLPSYGPFTGVGLDLSAGDRGLHVVYGPNEAGKSSTLRALKALLYGIPQKTPDGFLHGYSKLRVGAWVRDEDGRELAFLRRKGTKDTLLDLEGRALPEDEVERLLGGLSEGLFTSLFGLDHKELVRGGQEILEGGGEIGESLFAAALGGARLRETLKSLEKELEGLFAPRGRNPSVNQALDRYRAACQELQEATVSPSQWVEKKEALEKAEEETRRLEERICSRREKEHRIGRFRRALAPASRRRELTAERAELGELPRLRPSFPEERQKAEEAWRQAVADRRKALRDLERIEKELAEMPLPGSLLDEGEAIADLHQRLGACRKAGEDLPALAEELKRAEDEAARLLEGLRLHLPEERARTLRLGKEREEAIFELASRYRRAEEAARGARERAMELEDAVKALEAELERAEVPPDPAALGEILEALPADLEKQRDAGRSELAGREEECRLALARLRYWNGPLDALASRALPSIETVERYRKSLGEIDGQLARLEEEREESEREAAGLAGELEELARAGGVPSERDLTEARGARDATWALVRAVWLEGRQEAAAPQGGPEALAGSFEADLERADEVADRLRREADRVARRASLEVRLEKARRKAARLEEEIRERQAARERLEGAWVEEWRALEGFPRERPPAPEEMRAWLAEAKEIDRQGEELRGRRRALEELEEVVARSRDGLLRALARAGGGGAEEDSSLGALASRARAHHRMLDEVWKERRAQERERANRRAELVKARGKGERCAARFEEARGEWSRTMAEIGLAADIPPERAQAVLSAVKDLAAVLDRGRDLERRIEAIKREEAAYGEDVRAFVERASPDLGGEPPLAAVSALHRRFEEAREPAAARRGLEEERARTREALGGAERAIEAARARLEGLCREAGCEAVEALPEREERWRRGCELEGKIEAEEERLLEEAAGEALAAFLERLASVDGDKLAAEEEAVRSELAECEKALADRNREIGERRKELEGMDRGEAAAEARAAAASHLAEIRDGVERYLTVWIARKVLGREIERYRGESQGPVLARAGEIFSRLTLGSFAELRAAGGGGDRVVLEGVRRERDAVRVEGMSDGTRDQLYLALRLASLEIHLESHPPLPLVVDDLLVNFDDARAEAALEVLGELSSRTQVIFFTHHRHLVEIARRRVEEGVLQVPSYLSLEELERGRVILGSRRRGAERAAPPRARVSRRAR